MKIATSHQSTGKIEDINTQIIPLDYSNDTREKSVVVQQTQTKLEIAIQTLNLPWSQSTSTTTTTSTTTPQSTTAAAATEPVTANNLQQHDEENPY